MLLEIIVYLWVQFPSFSPVYLNLVSIIEILSARVKGSTFKKFVYVFIWLLNNSLTEYILHGRHLFWLNLVDIILFCGINLANVKSSINLIVVPLSTIFSVFLLLSIFSLCLWALNHHNLPCCGFILIYQFCISMLSLSEKQWLSSILKKSQPVSVQILPFLYFSNFLFQNTCRFISETSYSVFSIFNLFFLLFYLIPSLLWANFHFRIVLAWLIWFLTMRTNSMSHH